MGWLWPPEPQSSPRRVSPLLWPEVVERLLEELRLTQESSPTRLCSSVEVLEDMGCAVVLLLPRTWLLPLVTAVMGNPPAGWESVWATTTSMKMILIRWTLLSRLSCSMRTMTPGPSTMTSVGEEYPAGTQCTVSGWGTTSEGGSLGRVLMKVTVPVVSDDDCRGAYGQDDIADSMICAGLDAGGKDSCQGDSGGPFMCGSQLSGVVSWGYGCAEPGFPGVYTQTSYFISWLNSHMK